MQCCALCPRKETGVDLILLECTYLELRRLETRSIGVVMLAVQHRPLYVPVDVRLTMAS
jgi:hypothetical protein